MTAVTLSVDVMGGDQGCAMTVPAVAQLLKRHADVKVILVGRPEALAVALEKNGIRGHERVCVHPANEVVKGSDPVTVALRTKKHSSMRLSINLVKEGKAHAAVSAGNTGALMAMSHFVLKTLPAISRPAICTAIPTQNGCCYMLDLGANVEADSEQLLQFATMGAAMARVEGRDNPRVALLNIGEEAIKGSDDIKAAAKLLEASKLNYVGYIEGNGIFCDEADVVVCDGFVGNVALKTMEGVADLVKHILQQQAAGGLGRKLSALAALPLLTGLKQQLDPETYNGASLLGLNGIVVKSHGGTGINGFLNALEVALREAQRDLPALIGQALETGEETQ